jgi:DNA replication and repair protein RecF
MLNTALAQEQPLYYRELARYRKTLQQKNALLRGDSIDNDLLEIYNRTLIDSGTDLMIARNHFVRALADAARNVHALWSGGTEALEIRYAPNVAFELPTGDAIAAAFSDRLRERAEAERVRKASLVGPHRDDIHLNVNGIALSAYGSQGQQRTAVLALKVAEYTVMRERSGEAPLLLLDDVFSELDATRARAFLDEIGTFEQVFVTTTQVPAHFDAARVWSVQNASLIEVA